jgi:hypothetical protein
MEFEQKYAKELAALIADQAGLQGVMIDVHPDAVYGWHPVVFTTPSRAANAQNAAGRAAQELRGLYELRDDDTRALSRPLVVRVAGKELSIRTIGDAATLLWGKFGRQVTAGDWKRVNQAIAAARDDCTEAHRVLATEAIEQLCRSHGLLVAP